MGLYQRGCTQSAATTGPAGGESIWADRGAVLIFLFLKGLENFEADDRGCLMFSNT